MPLFYTENIVRGVPSLLMRPKVLTTYGAEMSSTAQAFTYTFGRQAIQHNKLYSIYL